MEANDFNPKYNMVWLILNIIHLDRKIKDLMNYLTYFPKKNETLFVSQGSFSILAEPLSGGCNTQQVLQFTRKTHAYNQEEENLKPDEYLPFS